MIPSTLMEWSEEAILSLLTAKIFEAEEFDFKEMLPHSKDDTGKARLRKSCCAFANSSGGFLVFGIADDRLKKPKDRIIGLDPTNDFPANFGSYPSLCKPSIHWEFRNPAISLSSGHLLQIVYIPRSWKAPHAVRDSAQGWLFMKRTNKGNEAMTFEEIRGSFLGFYEKRIRLQLLQSELISLRDTAATAFVSDPSQIESHYSLVTLDTQIIQSVLADTYPLMADSPQLYTVLTQLRQAVNVVNNKAQIFFSTAGLSFSRQDLRNRDHNEFMATACDRVLKLADMALALVTQVLAK
jgi:hypothetical protein